MHFPELKFMSMHLLKETLHIIAGAFNELRGYKTRRFVMILTTMKLTFLIFTTVKCYVSGRVELTQKVRCPIDVYISLSMMAWEQHGLLTNCLPQRVALVTN